MEIDTQVESLVHRLQHADCQARLKNPELALLRRFLASLPEVLTCDAPISRPDQVLRLKTILTYNKHLRTSDTQNESFPECSDARTLMDFVSEFHALTRAVEYLNIDTQQPRENSPDQNRYLAIFCAEQVERRISHVRDSIVRQSMHTNERREALIDLAKAIEYIYSTLRLSAINGWGYKITKESVPTTIFHTWEGHWRTARSIVRDFGFWASAMIQEGSTASSTFCDEDSKSSEQHVRALTKGEFATLAGLARFDASCLASAMDVSDAMPPAQRLSERTIRGAIKKLIALNLAERPEGDRQGARLTIMGRRLASKLAN